MLSPPRRLWLQRSISVTESPSSPMLDGSINPAFPFNSTVRFSTNFQRKRATGISPENPKTQVSTNKYEVLRTDAELTFNLVVVDIEPFQIHEFAELLRQLSCKKKVTTSTRNLKRSVRMLSSLPSRPQKDILISLRFVRAPHSGGIPPVNLCFRFRLSPPVRLRISSEVGSTFGKGPAR